MKVEDSQGKAVSGAVVNHFNNLSGNCDFEKNPEGVKREITNESGLVILFLPLNDMYKIQVKKRAECFQPTQMPDTLIFTAN